MPAYSARQISTPVIAALSIGCLLSWAFFLFSPSHAGHPVAYGILVVAEVLGMIQLLGAWSTLLLSPPAVPLPVLKSKHDLVSGAQAVPSVAVMVPVAGEPIETIRRTLLACRDMQLPHRTIVLDDGCSDDVRSLARELRIEYIRRPKREKWKAGNVNHALRLVKTDYVALFDSDHAPKPSFLVETLPYFLHDAKLAFVQTAQYCANRDQFISGGSAEVQDIFYSHIQAGKSIFNSSFFVGTNALFRRAALDDVGGFWEKSHSEDIWTSIKLHERGWKSHYLPLVLAEGESPETVDSYFRQQFRWARGSFEIFFKNNPLFSPFTLDQKLQYLHTTLFYFTSFSTLAFFILPLLYVYFGWRPLEVPEGPWHWAFRFVPYYLMTVVMAVHLLGRVPLWRTFVVAITAFPSHLAAFFSVLTGLNIRWSVTGVIRRKADYVTSVAPHLFLLLLSLGAIPLMSFSRDELGLRVIITLALLWNSAILISICKRAIPGFARAPVRSRLVLSAPTPSLA